MATRFSYFATSTDLKAIVQSLESAVSLQYMLAGFYSQEEYCSLQQYSSFLDYEHLGIAQGNHFRDEMFLVVPRGNRITPGRRSSPRGERYIITQEHNVPSVIWSVGGHWEDNMLIQGELATVHSDDSSKQMMTTIRKSFSKYCKRINGCYISRGVFSLKDTRLITVCASEDQDVDFVLPISE